MITTGNGAMEDLFHDPAGLELLPVKILADYRELGASGVIDFGTFSAEDTKRLIEDGIKVVNERQDGWNNPENKSVPPAPACSSCMKKLADGTVIMGRNMDLPTSHAPAIIFRTTGDGKETYDAVSLEYTSLCSITFDQAVQYGGFPQKELAGHIMVPCDTVNSEGLYLQVDMRESFRCTNNSTNPNGKLRICSASLTQYLGHCCATIAEALACMKELDIYDSKSANLDWSMAIGMMDKTGRYGVCEFVNNRIVWHEGRPGFACGQANFYWDKEGFKTGWGSGYGRWQKLMEHYNGIRTIEDMEKAMRRIWYSNLFTDGSECKNWKVDWLTEMQDKTENHISEVVLKSIYSWKEQYGISVDEELLGIAEGFAERQRKERIVWDNHYISLPENYYEIITIADLYTKCFAQLPIEARRTSGLMELSSFSYVADNRNPGYRLHIFQTNDVYHVGIHETKIERFPTEKLF